MIIVGIDAHKKTHTLVAVDRVGRRLAEVTLPATSEGHLRAVQWAAAQAARVGTEEGPAQVRFAVEDCRHLTRRLEGDLLRAGQPVVRVHTRLMAGARRSARRPGKSDPMTPKLWRSRRCASRTCRPLDSTGPRVRSSY